MQYNIHPLIVHFPVAFLFVYALIVILPLRHFFPKVAWKQIERVLLVVGVVGAFAALATGDTAEHMVRASHKLVETHSTFAGLATFVFCVLLVGEICRVISEYLGAHSKGTKTGMAAVIGGVSRIFSSTLVRFILALLGLVLLSIAGLLGGVIANGLSSDPFAPFVLSMLGISL